MQETKVETLIHRSQDSASIFQLLNMCAEPP